MEADIKQRKEDVQCFKEERTKFQIIKVIIEYIKEKDVMNTRENSKKEKYQSYFVIY